jgi:glycosyltransferase involved in cell wall biosynthesis
MHVLELGPYPPPQGGITRNLLAIREVLVGKGHQCSIVATAKSSSVEPERGVYHPASPGELIKLLKNLDYDVLHVHIGGDVNLRILAFLAVCAFFGRGKSVLTLHSGGYAVENVGRARRFSRDGFVFRRFRKIIAVNPLMIEMFEKFGVEKEALRLVYPFVLQNPDESVALPRRLQEFAEKHTPFLLAVCLLEDTYDLFMQIEALEKVLEKSPDAGLMIVGSGRLENDLKRAIAEKDYADRILLAGDVEHKFTLHLIKKADILLRTTRYDGDAIAIREALFLGTKVVATETGMRPAGVHLIPIHDPPALAESIAILAKDLRAEKAEKADDWSNIEKVVEIYEEVARS